VAGRGEARDLKISVSPGPKIILFSLHIILHLSHHLPFWIFCPRIAKFGPLISAEEVGGVDLRAGWGIFATEVLRVIEIEIQDCGVEIEAETPRRNQKEDSQPLLPLQ
jgi:hypothetical protein